MLANQIKSLSIPTNIKMWGILATQFTMAYFLLYYLTWRFSLAIKKCLKARVFERQYLLHDLYIFLIDLERNILILEISYIFLKNMFLDASSETIQTAEKVKIRLFKIFMPMLQGSAPHTSPPTSFWLLRQCITLMCNFLKHI